MMRVFRASGRSIDIPQNSDERTSTSLTDVINCLSDELEALYKMVETPKTEIARCADGEKGEKKKKKKKKYICPRCGQELHEQTIVVADVIRMMKCYNRECDFSGINKSDYDSIFEFGRLESEHS